MKNFFKPQITQINADRDIAEARLFIMLLSSDHLRQSAPSAVNLLQSGGEE
jgi:hypothetical protein